jgi:hypothetical protein
MRKYKVCGITLFPQMSMEYNIGCVKYKDDRESAYKIMVNKLGENYLVALKDVANKIINIRHQEIKR